MLWRVPSYSAPGLPEADHQQVDGGAPSGAARPLAAAEQDLGLVVRGLGGRCGLLALDRLGDLDHLDPRRVTGHDGGVEVGLELDAGGMAMSETCSAPPMVRSVMSMSTRAGCRSAWP